jgi:integral membrane protein
VFTVDLAIKARWKPGTTVATALAGTIPFLSFVFEHKRTIQVKSDYNL